MDIFLFDYHTFYIILIFSLFNAYPGSCQVFHLAVIQLLTTTCGRKWWQHGEIGGTGMIKQVKTCQAQTKHGLAVMYWNNKILKKKVMKVIDWVRPIFKLNKDQPRKLYQHLWIFWRKKHILILKAAKC